LLAELGVDEHVSVPLAGSDTAFMYRQETAGDAGPA